MVPSLPRSFLLGLSRFPAFPLLFPFRLSQPLWRQCNGVDAYSWVTDVQYYLSGWRRVRGHDMYSTYPVALPWGVIISSRTPDFKEDMTL